MPVAANRRISSRITGTKAQASSDRSGYAAVEYSGCHRWRASVAGAGNATRVRTVAWRLRYSASAVAMGLRPAMRPTTTGRNAGRPGIRRYSQPSMRSATTVEK